MPYSAIGTTNKNEMLKLVKYKLFKLNLFHKQQTGKEHAREHLKLNEIVREHLKRRT